MKNLLPIYYLNGGIYYRFTRCNLQTLVNNLPIFCRFFGQSTDSLLRRTSAPTEALANRPRWNGSGT